jgi:predicted TIM-barrel fold metal-dependent hydrolase
VSQIAAFLRPYTRAGEKSRRRVDAPGRPLLNCLHTKNQSEDIDVSKKIRVHDGDGHLFEDLEGIVKHMPSYYTFQFRGAAEVLRLYPPVDHLHVAPGKALPGAFGGNGKVGPKEWMTFMEEVGIESATLFPTRGSAFGKIVDRDWAIAVAHAYNKWLYETYLQLSPRFNGMCLIPYQEPEKAIEELNLAVTKYGMVGAVLPSTGFSGHLGAKQFWPIYAEANKLGCAIGIHGGCHEGFQMDDMNIYAPIHALGHPFSQLVCFAGIIFNGLLDRFPNVRWGFLEGGVAWLLVAMERFDRSWATHVHHDPRKQFIQLKDGEKIADYIRRHMKEGRIFIGCEGEEPDIAHAIDVLGCNPFLFSSDYPHEVNAEMCKHELDEIMESKEISDKDKELILHGNAEKLYRPKVSQPKTAKAS